MKRNGDVALVGAKRPEVVLAGHSHAVAMLDSVDREPARRVRAAVLVPRDGSHEFLGDPGYRDAFLRVAEGKVAGVVWDGNQHIGLFLVDSVPGFQVFRPGVVDAGHDPGRRWVSEEMLRCLWRGDAPWTTDSLEALLRQLAHASPRVVLFGTPPPKPERLVRAALGADPFFVSLLERESMEPDTVPLTPGPVMIAMWQVIQDIYRDAAADTGALFVPVPDSVMDRDGYLLDRYSPPGDTSHANGDYGAVMWAQLSDALGSRHA